MNRPTRSSPEGRAYLDLQNRARREKRGTQEFLTMYVVERWLARLSKSPYAEDFVLKGGMLMATFGVRRPTVDADTLARNLPSDPEAVARRVVEIADMADPEDGLVFMTETVKTSIIRDQARYSGVRVIMDARLATARVSLHLDVNFGDPVTPEPALVELPSLRGGSGPVRVLGYPIESVLAEKIVTAVDLGLANTRVRDFADICLLIGQRGVLCGTLREAIDATARFREVPLIPLSEATAGLGDLRSAAYVAYRRGLGATGSLLPELFTDAIAAAVEFTDPVLAGLDESYSWDPESHRWGTETVEAQNR